MDIQLVEMFGLDTLSPVTEEDHKWPQYFGIEFEIENPQPFGKEIPLWVTHNDDSLRNGIEYVLRTPMHGTKLEKAIANFYDSGLSYNRGPRTSTHIHVNMTDASLAQLRAMMVLMYVIEGPLYHVVGEGRKWAGYSMALSEMEPERLRKILASETQSDISQSIMGTRNNDKYYGFNVASVRKHGTVEFRYFPGGPSKEDLESWLDLIVQVKKASTNISITDMAERVNNVGDLLDLLREILSEDWINKLLANASPESLYETFTDVIALTVPDSEFVRRDRLVFLNDSVMRYVCKKLVKEEGKKYLEKMRPALRVVTVGEFQQHLQTARVADARALRGGQQTDTSATSRPNDFISFGEAFGRPSTSPAYVYGGQVSTNGGLRRPEGLPRPAGLRGQYTATQRMNSGAIDAERMRAYNQQLEEMRQASTPQPTPDPYWGDEPEEEPARPAVERFTFGQQISLFGEPLDVDRSFVPYYSVAVISRATADNRREMQRINRNAANEYISNTR